MAALSWSACACGSMRLQNVSADATPSLLQCHSREARCRCSQQITLLRYLCCCSLSSVSFPAPFAAHQAFEAGAGLEEVAPPSVGGSTTVMFDTPGTYQ